MALGLRHVQRWTSNSNVAKSCEGTSRALGRPASGPGGPAPPGPGNPGVTPVGRLNHVGQSTWVSISIHTGWGAALVAECGLRHAQT